MIGYYQDNHFIKDLHVIEFIELKWFEINDIDYQ